MSFAKSRSSIFLLFLYAAPFWLLLVFFPFADDPFVSVKESLFFIVLGCLFLFSQRNIFLSGAALIYSIYIFTVVFSSFFSHSLIRAAPYIFYHLASLSFLLLAPLKMEKRGITLICLLLSLFALFQFFNIDILFTGRIRGVPPNVMATTLGHKNFLADVLLLLWPLSALSLASFFWLAIVLTLSRAGILALFLQLALLPKVRFGGLKKQVLLFLLIFLGALSFHFFRRDFLERFRLKRDWREGSFFTRRLYWQTALFMGREHFFLGVGSRGFSYYYFDYYRKLPLSLRETFKRRKISPEQPENVHNDFLQVFAESGIVGFLSFAWLASYLALLALSRKDSFSLGVLAFFVSALVQFPLSLPYFFPILLLLSRRETPPTLQLSRFFSLGFPLLSGLFFWLGVSRGASEVYLYRARQLAVEGRVQAAQSDFTKSLAFYPTARGYFHRGVLEEKLHDPLFLRDYQKARELSGNLHIRWALARGAARVGNFSEAVKRYQELLSLQVFSEYEREWGWELAQVKALFPAQKKRSRRGRRGRNP